MVIYEQVVRMQRTCLGHVVHSVTVTQINGWYHCRVFVNGELNQEGRCKGREHIGATCRDLLRWEDKCGNWSNCADRARHRQGEKAYTRWKEQNERI